MGKQTLKQRAADLPPATMIHTSVQVFRKDGKVYVSKKGTTRRSPTRAMKKQLTEDALARQHANRLKGIRGPRRNEYYIALRAERKARAV